VVPGTAPPVSTRGPEKGLPLRSYPEFALPVGQRVRGSGRGSEALVEAARSALAAQGFRSVTPTRSDPTPLRPIVVAERELHRVRMQPSMRVAVWVLVGAGALIGVLDSLVVGTWALLLLWLAAFGLVGFLLWLRYGRQYESELVLAVAIAATEPGRDPGGADLVIRGGRVRFIGFDGARTPTEVVDCPVPLMDALAAAVRQVESLA
jgi:hypothetical protein